MFTVVAVTFLSSSKLCPCDLAIAEDVEVSPRITCGQAPTSAGFVASTARLTVSLKQTLGESLQHRQRQVKIYSPAPWDRLSSHLRRGVIRKRFWLFYCLASLSIWVLLLLTSVDSFVFFFLQMPWLYILSICSVSFFILSRTK